jgi:hypothetical protein
LQLVTSFGGSGISMRIAPQWQVAESMALLFGYVEDNGETWSCED